MDDSSSDDEVMKELKRSISPTRGRNKPKQGEITERITTPKMYKIEACHTPVVEERMALLNDHGRAELDDYTKGDQNQSAERRKHKNMEKLHGRPNLDRKTRRKIK